MYQMLFTTCPDDETADRIARNLVEERLAACVNALPPVQSTYAWRGQVETASERLLIVKIRRADYPRVEQRIRELHPYEIPEIIAIPIETGLPAYLAWLQNPDASA